MLDRSVGGERRKMLEEAVRLLEAARGGFAKDRQFDDVRMDSHIVTAITAARAALDLAERGSPTDAAAPDATPEESRDAPV